MLYATSMDRTVVICMLSVAIMSVLTDGQTNVPDPFFPAVCFPYCDKMGYMQMGQICNSEYKFCCGDLNVRYCCNDDTLRILNQPTDVTGCPTATSWWDTNWRAVLGLLGALVTVLVITSVCYYCCIFFVAKTGRSRCGTSGVDNRCNSIESEYDLQERSRSFCFNPESPCAFQPPAYSLSKNPPSYFQLMPLGYSNMALALSESSENIQRDGLAMSPLDGPPTYDMFSSIGEPPPPYTMDTFSLTQDISTPPARRHSDLTNQRALTKEVPVNSPQRRSSEDSALDAAPPRLTINITRRRSTTCITTPEYASDHMPPLY